MSHQPIWNFIGGAYKAAASGLTSHNSNPATGERLGEVTASGVEEVEAAVAAARAALPAWKSLPSPKRGEILWRAADIMRRRKDELSRALTMEEGKSLTDAGGEVHRAANCLEFAAGEGRRMHGQVIPSELGNNMIYTRRIPLGVVGGAVLRGLIRLVGVEFARPLARSSGGTSDGLHGVEHPF